MIKMLHKHPLANMIDFGEFSPVYVINFKKGVLPNAIFIFKLLIQWIYLPEVSVLSITHQKHVRNERIHYYLEVKVKCC